MSCWQHSDHSFRVMNTHKTICKTLPRLLRPNNNLTEHLTLEPNYPPNKHNVFLTLISNISQSKPAHSKIIMTWSKNTILLTLLKKNLHEHGGYFAHSYCSVFNWKRRSFGFGAWNYDKNGRNSIFYALDEFCCADHVLEQRDKNRTILLTAIN